MMVKVDEEYISLPRWLVATVSTVLIALLTGAVSVSGWAIISIGDLREAVARLEAQQADRPPAVLYQQYVDQRFTNIERSLDSLNSKMDRVLQNGAKSP